MDWCWFRAFMHSAPVHGLEMVNRRTGRQQVERGMQTDEQQQQSSLCVLTESRGWAAENQAAAAAPRPSVRAPGAVSAQPAAQESPPHGVRHGSSVCPRCSTGRRWRTLAARCWINDLRNSRRSQRTEKAVFMGNECAREPATRADRATRQPLGSNFGKYICLLRFIWVNFNHRAICAAPSCAGALTKRKLAVFLFGVTSELQTPFKTSTIIYFLPVKTRDYLVRCGLHVISKAAERSPQFGVHFTNCDARTGTKRTTFLKHH